MAQFTELLAALRDLYNYWVLFKKCSLISPCYLWFEIQSFIFDLKQQQFAILQTSKDATFLYRIPETSQILT